VHVKAKKAMIYYTNYFPCGSREQIISATQCQVDMH